MTQAPTKSPAVSERERIQAYIDAYEDAPNWGGPTLYPTPPSISDLKAILARLAHDARLAPAPEIVVTEGQRERALAAGRAIVHGQGDGTYDEATDAIHLLLAALGGSQPAPEKVVREAERLRSVLVQASNNLSEMLDDGQMKHRSRLIDLADGLRDAALAQPEAASIPPSDMADILETIGDAADDWKDQGYASALAEVRDMAAVGRSLIEAIADAKYAGSPIEHWMPADGPAEIVTDLLNKLIDAQPEAARVGQFDLIEKAISNRLKFAVEHEKGEAVSPNQLASAVCAALVQPEAAPIPMMLHCPQCGLQHIDDPDERTEGWDNPPHRSHLCHGCKCIWRAADVATEGVRSIATVGKADTWAAEQPEAARVGGSVDAIAEICYALRPACFIDIVDGPCTKVWALAKADDDPEVALAYEAACRIAALATQPAAGRQS